MLNFKDKQAREDTQDLKELVFEMLAQMNENTRRYNLFIETLGYEYKEESKEAGWVKKPENVTTNKVPMYGMGMSVGGSGANAGIAFQEVKPKKTKSK